jgi:hypothetical protein
MYFLNFFRKINMILHDHIYIHKKSQARHVNNAWENYKEESMKKCYEEFKKYFSDAVFVTFKDIRKYAITEALLNAEKDKNLFYLEFGVFSGGSINFFSKYVPEIYGFDSFQGLKEDWQGFDVQKGHFNLHGKIPSLNHNVIPIVGWVQDTLDKFLKEKKPKINFVHMDLDTYPSSKYVMEKIKPYLVKGSIILFDEIYNYAGWEVGEYKALKEVFKDEEYQFIAFSRDNHSAVIKIL